MGYTAHREDGCRKSYKTCLALPCVRQSQWKRVVCPYCSCTYSAVMMEEHVREFWYVARAAAAAVHTGHASPVLLYLLGSVAVSGT